MTADCEYATGNVLVPNGCRRLEKLLDAQLVECGAASSSMRLQGMFLLSGCKMLQVRAFRAIWFSCKVRANKSAEWGDEIVMQETCAVLHIEYITYDLVKDFGK